MDLRAFSRKLDKHAAAVALYYFIYKVNRVYPRSDLRTERFWRSTKLVEMCFGSGLPITASRFAPDTLRWAVVKFEKSPRDRIDSQATAKKMPADDIRMSNDELMLMISSLELVATILPAGRRRGFQGVIGKDGGCK